MNDRVIEVVNFKLTEGVTIKDFLASVPPTNTFLQTRNGFVSRRLSQNEDGSWLEHIEWESMNDAKEASEALMAEESCHPMMASIDMESVKMGHNQLMISLG